MDTFGYLWSWHLWVTPYKPDRRKPWEDGKYEYTEDVTSGSVFRYAPGTVNEPGNDLWKSDGKYYNKYIMDRNLGATTRETPTLSHDLKNSGGLQYQFGRKDPFVIAGVTLYKAASSSVQKTKTYAKNINKGVKYPDWFYVVKKTRTYWDWVEPNNYSDNLWNNPFPSEKEFKDKSFFDPCPEGWRIPLKGTWNIFGSGTAWHDIKYKANAMGGFDKGWRFYVGNGFTAYYPVTGYRTSYGDLVETGGYGGYWSASPRNKNEGYFMSFRSGYVAVVARIGSISLHPSDNNRVFSYSIRCVQE